MLGLADHNARANGSVAMHEQQDCPAERCTEDAGRSGLDNLELERAFKSGQHLWGSRIVCWRGGSTRFVDLCLGPL